MAKSISEILGIDLSDIDKLNENGQYIDGLFKGLTPEQAQQLVSQTNEEPEKKTNHDGTEMLGFVDEIFKATNINDIDMNTESTKRK